MGKCSSEHGVPSSSSRTCNVTHPSNSHSLGKLKNAIDLIVDEGHTECKCDETGICPCAIPWSESSSLQTLQTPSSPHTRSCHGSIHWLTAMPATSQSSCCFSQAESPINCRCNSPLPPLDSADLPLLSPTSGPPGGVRRRKNSAPLACARPVVQSPYTHAATSNSTQCCCNQSSLMRLPPNLAEPGWCPSILQFVHITDSGFHVDLIFNASLPTSSSYGSVRSESSGQAPRFA